MNVGIKEASRACTIAARLSLMRPTCRLYTSPTLFVQARWSIHSTSWKVNSQKSTYRMLHSLPLWERRMAYFSILELIARHKIWEQ
jgi:hypothetical protein